MDYPYRLNYSLDMGVNNREATSDTVKKIPSREDLNLDYFYRFGLENRESYQNYSLHLYDSEFNIDDYLCLYRRKRDWRTET